IVFPEGDDPRVLHAATRLARDGVVKPVLIGAPPAHPPAGVTFIDPVRSNLVQENGAYYHERRKSKGVTQVETAAIGKKPLYFATLMVGIGDAQGSVGGAANSTADTVRAALHCVGPDSRAKLVSSVFLMALQNRAHGHHGMLAFADCAVVIEPTPIQ